MENEAFEKWWKLLAVSQLSPTYKDIAKAAWSRGYVEGYEDGTLDEDMNARTEKWDNERG